jgi:quinoprotein glucose dehydrogenase
MTKRLTRNWAARALVGALALMVTAAIAGLPGDAQQKGDWPSITGGDTGTRYSALDQINAQNFNNLKVAWEWNGSDAGVEIGEINARGLPIYVDGMLFTVSGPRRTVLSLDPATGKTLWAFQEPTTPRHDYSMRSNHGKGVVYTKINGKGVVLVTTPGFFLHAGCQDRQADRRLGRSHAVPSFGKSGSVDMLKDIIADWQPWKQTEQSATPSRGCRSNSATSPPARRRSSSTTLLVVGNSAEQGTTRPASRTSPATSSATT